MSDQDEIAFRYDKMVEKALRSVVQQALQEVIEEGLCDEHHFYITFQTDFPGVDIPDYLKERYPNEMTIVLQHQFYDLEVNSTRFLVMLSFNNVPERLVIPLAAITIFADPSVNFALQFQPLDDDLEDSFEDFDSLDFSEDELAEDAQPAKTGEVISLDSFRKKPEKGAKETKKANDTKKKPKKKTATKATTKAKAKPKTTKAKTVKKKPKKADKEKDKKKD